MSEPRYTLRDIDNRDDAGAPFEIVAPLAELAGYVDGPLRGDLTDPDLFDTDEIVAAMRKGLLSAEHRRQLEQAGVYVSPLPVGGEHADG